MTRKRRMVVLLTALFCLLFIFPAMRTDAARATGTVKNRILNVREDTSTSSKIVCKLSQGTKVTIASEKTGTDNMKWYKVSFSYNGSTKEGYVRADLLNVTGTVTDSSSNTGSGTNAISSVKSEDTSEGSEVLYVNKTSVRVREHAEVGSKIVAGLEKGAEVKAKSTKTGNDGKKWTKVSFTKDGEKVYGYIRSDLLTSVPPSGTTVSAGDDEDVLYVTASAVRVREHASDSSTVVSNLLKGDKVKRKSTKTGSDGKQWTKVSFEISGTKYHGYIRSDYLAAAGSTGSSTSGSDETMYVTASAVRVRKSASNSDDIVANLLKGDKVKKKSAKTGSDGKEWTKVTFEINGTKFEGYIRSDYLSSKKPDGTADSNTASSSNTSTSSSDSSELRYVAVSAANLRDSASASSAVLATLSKGQAVKEKSTKTGSDGKKWTKVSYTAPNGTKYHGYIRSDLIKK